MVFHILTAKDFKTTNWSGGTTTQLFIYPPTADYAKRDFNFRLSSARVEVEKSDFTALSGVSRKIMVLDGMITINHENHYTKTLNKFDSDAFEGDWKTSAEGTCTDFNLMTTEKTRGELTAFIIKESEFKKLPIDEIWNWLFIYVTLGKVSVDLDNEKLLLKQGNLLVVNDMESKTIHFSGIENSELVVVEINNN